MQKQNYLCGLLSLISWYCFSQSQQIVIPANGENITLRLNAALSDEFNGTTVDRSKWKVSHDPNYHLDSANVSVSGGRLRIKYTEFDTIRYTGGIESVRWNYHYGYYEAKYQLPYYIKPGTSQRSNLGIGQCYWLYNKVVTPGKEFGDFMFGEEIDMFESYTIDDVPINGRTSLYHNGLHVMRRPSKVHPTWEAMQSKSAPLWEKIIPADLTLIEHTYGFLYLPNRMHFYIDGVEQTDLRITSNNINADHDYFPIHPMYLRLDGYVHEQYGKGGDPRYNQDIPNGVWPLNPWSVNPEWVVDYIRYYELGIADVATITNVTQLNAYKIKPAGIPLNSINGVKNNVTINGSNVVLPTHPQPGGPDGAIARVYDPYNQANSNYPNYLIRTAGKTIIKGTFKAPRGSNFQVSPAPYSQSVPKMLNAELNDNDVQDIENNIGLTVYPNPANSKVTVKYTEKINTVEVYDSFGKLLQNITVGDKSSIINIAGYASGLYILKIYHDKGIVSYKVMKQ